MSQIQQFNDSSTIRNQTIPVGAVVGDLLFLNNSGWNLRTSVNDPIDGYVAVADGATSVITVGNGMTVYAGSVPPGTIYYEDTTNPAKITTTSGGRIIGKAKGAFGGNVPYEGNSFLIECFQRQTIAWSTSQFFDKIPLVFNTPTLLDSYTVTLTEPRTFLANASVEYYNVFFVAKNYTNGSVKIFIDGVDTYFCGYNQILSNRVNTTIDPDWGVPIISGSKTFTLGVGTHTIEFMALTDFEFIAIAPAGNPRDVEVRFGSLSLYSA